MSVETKRVRKELEWLLRYWKRKYKKALKEERIYYITEAYHKMHAVDEILSSMNKDGTWDE